ncbi:MAG: GntR family transcriptional regulator [Thermodesulfovibrionales bacterium]|nr:GntR family transcriptional regulator [Thermodesulfovibrionales bacterium]
MDKAELKQKVYSLVEQSMGKKKLKQSDIEKKISEETGVSRQEVKEALRELIDEGKLIYTYFGGSFVEIPPKQ